MPTRTYAQQKAGLTRVIKTGNAEKVRAECERTVKEWEDDLGGRWPDDWSRWERALRDFCGFGMYLDDLG